LNIVHVVENLDRGGLERCVIDLALAQREAGHACKVACLFQRGALSDELERNGIQVVACGKRSGVDIRALTRLRAILRASPGAVVHTHNAVAHYHGVLSGYGLRLRGILNTRHGMGGRDGSERTERRYRWAMPRTDYAVAVCEAARARFAIDGVRPRRALLSIPNGIHCDKFHEASDSARTALLHELDLPADSRIIGSVGRLAPVKDQAVLVRALPLLRRKLPAVLVVVGDGPLHGQLAQLAIDQGVADSVRFLGDRGDVARLLAGFDVFALSSTSEGYSIALLEAAAAGLPIVATDVGGNREIVSDGATGRLVRPESHEAMADALQEVLLDRTCSSEMGRRGRQWARTEASVHTMAHRYLELYAALPPRTGKLG
jgi:glycosyltransferase involved in cell wall biosynthesis